MNFSTEVEVVISGTGPISRSQYDRWRDVWPSSTRRPTRSLATGSRPVLSNMHWIESGSALFRLVGDRSDSERGARTRRRLGHGSSG